MKSEISAAHHLHPTFRQIFREKRLLHVSPHAYERAEFTEDKKNK